MSHGDFSFYEVMKYLPRDLPDLILDAGCGVGELGFYLRAFPGRSFSRLRGRPRLWGMDVNEDNIQRLEVMNIYDRLIKEDLINVTDYLQEVPLTVCLETLEHIEKEKALEVLLKLSLISERLLIMVPYGFMRNEGLEREFNHVSSWVPRDFEMMGLRVVVVEPILRHIPRVLRPFYKILAWTRRLIKKKDPRRIIALNYDPEEPSHSKTQEEHQKGLTSGSTLILRQAE